MRWARDDWKLAVLPTISQTRRAAGIPPWSVRSCVLWSEDAHQEHEQAKVQRVRIEKARQREACLGCPCGSGSYRAAGKCDSLILMKLGRIDDALTDLQLIC